MTPAWGRWARAGLRRVLAPALALGLTLPALAAAQGAGPRTVDPVDRARTREELTATRARSTLRRARLEALLAYRLARRREAAALGDPARRAEIARALDAAVSMLRRSAFEAAALERELSHARKERSALESGAREPAPAAEAPAGELVAVEDPEGPVEGDATHERLPWPARGTVVGTPGRRRDPATATEAVSEAIEILSRLNDPARAVAAGRVKKTVALPQGGHAVVVEHPGDRISITSGLRQLAVAPGDEVAAGATLGLVGRDLDGAPVLTFELVHAGVPVDPRAVLSEPRARDRARRRR